ncbi:MAG: hypothetical protein QXV69_07225 [Sulfolobaceae archaeon]
MNEKELLRGNLISLIASIIILAGLVLILQRGIYYALSKEFLMIMTSVWILSIPSLISYHRSGLEKRWILDYFGATAIIITFLGLTLAYTGSFLGIEIIVFGYLFEPIAGISIYITTFNSISKIYSSLFFFGAIIFTLGLPLYLFNLGIVSIFGDLIKILGIITLIYTINKRKGITRITRRTPPSNTYRA